MPVVEEILPFLPGGLAELLAGVRLPAGEALEEVRVGRMRPIRLVLTSRDAFVGPGGRIQSEPHGALVVDRATFDDLLGRLTRWSLYAWQEELRHGFLTLPGGHRVGLAGRGVVEGGRVVTLSAISSVVLRLQREVESRAAWLLPLLNEGGHLLSTILVSPPRAGKTTLLRDLARLVSWGPPGRQVVVVDERSEIAGMSEDGVLGRDLGPRTDVLDGIPKAEGMRMAIRALAPEVLVTDEVGRPEDALALLDAQRAGVAVLASAHAGSFPDFAARPSTRTLLKGGVFQRVVLLSRRLGPGTVEEVRDARGRLLFSFPKEGDGSSCG